MSDDSLWELHGNPLSYCRMPIPWGLQRFQPGTDRLKNHCLSHKWAILELVGNLQPTTLYERLGRILVTMGL